jgi:hypothetical protein
MQQYFRNGADITWGNTYRWIIFFSIWPSEESKNLKASYQSLSLRSDL